MTTDNQDINEEKVAEAVQFFLDGGTIGDMAGMTDEDYEAVYAIAYNFMGASKYDKAAELLKFLVLNDPTKPRWYYALGVAEQSRGDFDAALYGYSMAAVLDVEDPLPHLQGGYCLMALGKYREAVEALDGAVDTAKNRPGSGDVLAQAKSLLETARAKLSSQKG